MENVQRSQPEESEGELESLSCPTLYTTFFLRSKYFFKINVEPPGACIDPLLTTVRSLPQWSLVAVQILWDLTNILPFSAAVVLHSVSSPEISVLLL